MNLASSVALISDLHGNSWALDAALADILDGPLDPTGTADRLLALGKRLRVRLHGNDERLLIANLAPQWTRRLGGVARHRRGVDCA